MLSVDGVAKITDFGVSIHQYGQLSSDTDKFKNKITTFHISSPEVLKHDQYSEASDWWAFGCLLYEMASG